MNKIIEVIWLIGAAQELPNKALFTNHDVLKGYFHLRNVKKQPVPKCVTNLVNRISHESEHIGFLTLNKATIRARLQRLLAEYDQLRKNRKADVEWQVAKENAFSEKLNETFKCYFESSPPNSQSTVKIEG
jgi:hypothetical protein